MSDLSDDDVKRIAEAVIERLGSRYIIVSAPSAPAPLAPPPYPYPAWPVVWG